jgi:hypothetical protein
MGSVKIAMAASLVWRNQIAIHRKMEPVTFVVWGVISIIGKENGCESTVSQPLYVFRSALSYSP